MELFTSTETIVRSSSNYVYNPINVELAEYPYNDIRIYMIGLNFFVDTHEWRGDVFGFFFSNHFFMYFFLFLFFHGQRRALQ